MRFPMTDAALSNLMKSAFGAGLLGYRVDDMDAVGRPLAEAVRERISSADFGATGDGTTDETSCLRNAVRCAYENQATLDLTPGVHLVSGSIAPNKQGPPLREGFSIRGVGSGAPLWRTGTMPCVLKARPDFPAGEAILDLRWMRRTNVENIGLDGSLCVDQDGLPAAIGVVYGQGQGEVVDHYYASRHLISGCAIHKFYRGVVAADVGQLKMLFNSVSDCSNVGIALRSWAGDFQLIGNNVHTTRWDDNASPPYYTGTDLATGAGIMLAHVSGNGMVIGGKIEYNSKGILVYGSQGIQILGVQFDTNAWANIMVAPETTFGGGMADGIVIAACRMLCGGLYYCEDTFWGGASIHVKSETDKWASVVIAGNSIHKGASGTAWDFAPEDLPSHPAGPITAGIRVGAAGGECDVCVEGNDMKYASLMNAILAEGAKARVYASGNMTNLPFTASGEGRIYTSMAGGTARQESYGTAPPVSGDFDVKDIRWNTAAAGTGWIGWVCTAPGNPGTWKGFGLIEP